MTKDWPEGIPSPEEMTPIFAAMQESIIIMDVDMFTLFCALGALQLACRHPEYTGPSRDIVESFARQIEQNMADIAGPAVAKLIALGWDPAYDVDTKGE